MNPILERSLFPIVIGLLAVSATAVAGDADRAQRWETTLQARYTPTQTLKFENGVSAQIESETGFGLGASYNFDNKKALGLDIAWNSLDYTGTATQAGGPSQTVRAKAYTSSFTVNGTYHFFEGPLTPYIQGNVGFTYTDSGIPAGVSTGCWWYPWYGYICGPVTYSKTSTDWTYGIGAGLRWDVTPGFFLRAGVQQQWIGIESASGTPNFTIGRFDVGFKF